MDLTQLITLIATVLTAGWVSAYLVQLVKREQWPSWVKLVLSFVMAAIVAVATAWLTGDVTNIITVWKEGGLTSEQILTFFTLIYTSAAAWYRYYFTGSGWAETVAKLGSKE
jgi:hypothetical protein